jgi:hypothetical protein
MSGHEFPVSLPSTARLGFRRRCWNEDASNQLQSFYSGDGWYTTPMKSSKLSRAQHCRLLGILERFSRPDDISAAKAISVGLEVKSHAPDIQLSRTRIPRMTESSFSFSSTCKPFLLENRIAVLRLAAEVLCLMEGTEPIDLRRRRTLADLLSSGRLTINETLPQRSAL